MTAVTDFTEIETRVIETTPKERWPGQDIERHAGDAEIKLLPGDRCELSLWLSTVRQRED